GEAVEVEAVIVVGHVERADRQVLATADELDADISAGGGDILDREPVRRAVGVEAGPGAGGAGPSEVEVADGGVVDGGEVEAVGGVVDDDVGAGRADGQPGHVPELHAGDAAGRHRPGGRHRGGVGVGTVRVTVHIQGRVVVREVVVDQRQVLAPPAQGEPA